MSLGCPQGAYGMLVNQVHIHRMTKSFAYCALAVLGAAISPAEASDVTLDYIEADGAQRILTDYTPSSNSTIEVTISWSALATANETIFCSRGTSATNNTFTLFKIYNSTSKSHRLRFDYGVTEGTETVVSLAVNTEYTISCSSNGLYFAGSKIADVTQADFTAANPLMLFARYLTTPSTSLGDYGKFRLHAVKIHEDETLVKELTPAVDLLGAGGKLSLYDGENHFANLSTTPFAEGADAEGTGYYQLSLASAAQGTVTTDNSGVYAAGTTVQIGATPAVGYAFLAWKGDFTYADESNDASTTVTMNARVILTANYLIDGPARRVYVAPTACGTEDGSSWENAMNSIASAYAKAGETSGGGEVWIKGGRYAYIGEVAMLPNVIVRGGFAGTETSADEADPEANPVIINSVTSDTWLNTSPELSMWTGEDNMTFQYPPDDALNPGYYMTIGYTGKSVAFVNTDGVKVGRGGFYGLTFFHSQTRTIRIEKVNETNFFIKKCRFLACNWYVHSQHLVVYSYGTGLDVEDCEFAYCQNVVYVTTASTNSAVTTNTFRNCTFRGNSPNWNNSVASGGIVAENNAELQVYGCTFHRCVTANKASMTRSGAIVLNNYNRPFIAEDTIFELCGSPSTEYIKAATVFIYPASVQDIAFNRCRFEKCYLKTKHPGAHVAQSTALGIDGAARLWINDCAFIGNEYAPASMSGNGGASCIAQCNLTGTSGAIVNTLFDDNRAVGSSSAYTEMYAIGKAWGGGQQFAIVNCVFKDNECGYLNGTGETVYGHEIRPVAADNENLKLGIVNTVFENSAADYHPWQTNWLSTANLHYNFASVTCSSDWQFGTGHANGFRLGTLVTNAVAGLDAPRTNGIVIARAVTESSTYVRSGIPAYRATNGDIYMYDRLFNAAKPWRLLRIPSTVYTEEEANGLGLTLGMKPIADAFGRDRNPRRCALGQLDYRIFGLKVFLR